MLHTKLHENRSTGSGVDAFEGCLPYISIAANMVM